MFRTAKLCFAVIKHSDWLKLVMGVGTANQSALFQGSILLHYSKFVHDISSNGQPTKLYIFLSLNQFERSVFTD